MPTVLLVRHGRTTANASGVLAGWTPGVGLDETGVRQAEDLGRRLSTLSLAAVVCSPLQRCRETAAAIVAVPGPVPPRRRGEPPADGTRPQVQDDERLGEARYGDWTGRALKDLAREPLWATVQAHPSAVTFPGEQGESMPDMQVRAVRAVREHDTRVGAQRGPDAVWVAVSHGDVIKAVLADALGMHLDSFQRIVVDTCSVSVVRYTPLRPFAVRVNDTGGDLSTLEPRARTRGRARRPASPAALARASEAVVGGATGAPEGSR